MEELPCTTVVRYDIASNIMSPRKLSKVKQALTGLTLHPQGVRERDLVRIAKKLGRTRVQTGKHPTYIRDGDPELSPALSIPSHPGDMPVGTVLSVAEHLLNDVDVWELHLLKLEKD